MEIHITMTSGGHFKITDPAEAQRFYNQWGAGQDAIIYVTVDGWGMELMRTCIEAVAVRVPEGDETPF